MLRITLTQETNLTTLELEGKLAGPWVSELEKAWRTAKSTGEGAKIRVHLRSISYIDAAGKELLAQMHREGVELAASGCMNRAIVAQITGEGAKSRWLGWVSRKNLLMLILVTGLFLVPATRAEEKPQEKAALRLTLRGAVGLALKQNPQVQIAVLTTAQSSQDQAIALSALLPQAQLQVSDAALRGNIETSLGHRIPGFPQHSGPFQVFEAGPQFSMPVFDLTLWRRWQASRQGVRANEAQQQSVREQVVLLVVSQYLGTLRAAADVRAAQSRVELAQALYDQAADLQKHGVGTGIDTLRANVELQNEKQRLILAETQQKTSLYGLGRLLNLDPRQPIELGDELSFFETPEFHPEESLESAWASRPEMRALSAREQVAGYQKRAASESRLPAFRFAGAWAYQGVSAASAIPTYEYQVGMGVPLFTSGRIHAEIVRADLELKKIAQDREDLRSQIALEVKTAIANLESARHEVDVANLGVTLAQEEVSQARDRFQAGVANNIEVISAQDALARANDNQIAALYRYSQARADLARAIGQMESLYAK
jgi:outer membrane protein TolC/ABC-type transporter Mla MlaB component